MPILTDFILATFTTPELIETDPYSLFWLLPLVALVVVVYKATKLVNIEAVCFIKESIILILTIVVTYSVVAVILMIFTWFITERLPLIMALASF